MCPSGAGQHASGMASAWSCCDFNMFGFNWASDCSCLSTAVNNSFVIFSTRCLGVFLPADLVWSLEGAPST